MLAMRYGMVCDYVTICGCVFCVNRQQLIKPMGVREDGTLAPLEETIRACRNASTDSDSD